MRRARREGPGPTAGRLNCHRQSRDRDGGPGRALAGSTCWPDQGDGRRTTLQLNADVSGHGTSTHRAIDVRGGAVTPVRHWE